MTPDMFDCFLILEHLRRHRCAFIFMHLPAQPHFRVKPEEEEGEVRPGTLGFKRKVVKKVKDYFERDHYIDLFYIVYKLMRG